MEREIKTTGGTFLAHYSARGLSGLDFPGTARRAKPDVNLNRKLPPDYRQWHILTTRALKDMLAGRVPAALPPLDLSGGTAFQQKVWNILRQIKMGKTMSYAEVAAAIGNPKAFRAVGSACGANPIPVLVPCHRVLVANHGLGGFGGGLTWKRRLLACESICVRGETLSLDFKTPR